MDNTGINWESLKSQLTDQALTDLRRLIGSAVGDITTYATKIGQHQVEVLQMAAGPERDALQAELVGQLRVLGEQHRIELNDAAWAEFTVIFNTAISIASRVLIVAATAV